MIELINEDLKDMLSFHETLALLCFNINFAQRYRGISISKLSYLLGISEEKLEKASRIFKHIGMADIILNGKDIQVEMKEPQSEVVKNTIFEVIREKRLDFSLLYAMMMRNETGEEMGVN
jgi:hypothetical protein